MTTFANMVIGGSTEPDTTEVEDPPRRRGLWKRWTSRTPLVSQAFGRLVADRQATADTIVAAPAPLQPIDLTDDARVAEVLELAVRVGEVVLASGTGVIDTSAQVRFITETYGLSRCSIDVTYNAIRISASRGAALPPASTMRVVHYRTMDFTRLAAVDRLTRRIRTELVPPADARAALDALTSGPHPYSRWVSMFGWAVLAASIAALLGAGVTVAAISFVTTAVIEQVNRIVNHYNLPPFFQAMIGGAIAATPAVLLSEFGGPFGRNVDPALLIAAGITVLLSGLQLVGAVQDAITGAPITAAARMLEVLMMTGGIIAGIVLTLRIGVLAGVAVPPIDLGPARAIGNLPLQVAAASVAAMAYALACYSERRALAAAAFGGGVGNLCYLLAQHTALGPALSSGIAATVIGLAGGLIARRALTPPIVVAVAGIVALLPGLKLYRGLYGLLEDDLLVGFNYLFAAFVVGCSLAAGVTLGEWFDRTVRRPPILRRFGEISRPIVHRLPRLPVVLTKTAPSPRKPNPTPNRRPGLR